MDRCRHCQTLAIGRRRRGLCWKCYLDPAIRAQYPSQSNLGNRQRGEGCQQEDRMDDPPLPEEPTEALPGSAERIEVMRERDTEGCHVRHPDDGQVGELGEPEAHARKRSLPLWRAILPTGHVYGGIFAADKSQARSELKKRLKLERLPAGTRMEKVREPEGEKERSQGSGSRGQEAGVRKQGSGVRGQESVAKRAAGALLSCRLTPDS